MWFVFNPNVYYFIAYHVYVKNVRFRRNVKGAQVV